MSRETLSTTIYTASAMAQVAAALPTWYRQTDALMAGMTSAGLQGLAEAPALIQAADVPAWLQALTTDMQTALINPDTRLGATSDLSRPIASAEATATSKAVTESLDAEGFMTRMVIDGDLGFVEARRGHETVLVEVQGTTLHRDRAGLDDATCATSDAAFEAQMASRGFRLVSEQVNEHRNIPGGELIRNAAKRNRRNLADGAAQARRSMAASPATRQGVASR